MREHKAQRLIDDFRFLEAPKWHGDKLWVSDVFDHKVYRLGLDGSREVVCEVPHRPSGLGFLPDGTPIVVSSKNRRLCKIIGSELVLYADLSSHAACDVNDFTVDAEGRIYVGNFGYDYDAGEPRKTSCIHRVDPDGTISTAASEVDFPNGMAILDQGRTLVVAETWEGNLIAFDRSADGALSNRRVFADLGDRFPDGICADAEGAVWVACFNTGEFLRVLDGGEITDRIVFDGRGVSCAIGGPDGHTLFCTVFCGPVEDIAPGKRKAAVFTLTVDVGAASAVI